MGIGPIADATAIGAEPHRGGRTQAGFVRMAAAMMTRAERAAGIDRSGLLHTVPQSAPDLTGLLTIQGPAADTIRVTTAVAVQTSPVDAKGTVLTVSSVAAAARRPT